MTAVIKKPRVSVVIPSWDASRSGNLPLLLRDLEEQSLIPDEVKVVERTSPNGRARNSGVTQTTGDILIFLDDDVRLGTSCVIQTFTEYLKENTDLGMVGTSQVLPEDSSKFQLRCASQLSRSQSPVVSELTESDMVTTQCCAMRRAVLEEVGGFHDRIRRGVDPELRLRVRNAGYRIAVVPNSWHFHPMPGNMKALLTMAWRDGDASAYARKHFPETVLITPEGHVGDFEARQTLVARIGRNAARLVLNTVSGRWYGMAYGLVYAFANISGSVRNRK